MSGLRGRSLDTRIAAALLVLAAALWFWLIPSFAGAGDQVLLPRFVTIVIAILALMMLATSLLALGRKTENEDPFVEGGGGEPAQLLVLALVWGVYALAIRWVGFYIGGVAVLVASFLLMGIRRPLPIAGWTLGTAFSLWLVFERFFQLRLPRGALERTVLGLF